jgi:hypothetical protein
MDDYGLNEIDCASAGIVPATIPGVGQTNIFFVITPAHLIPSFSTTAADCHGTVQTAIRRRNACNEILTKKIGP